MSHLSQQAKTLVASGSSAAAMTDVTTAVIDRANFEYVRFIAVLGDVTATSVLTLKAQTGEASDGSDMADVAGCTTAAFTADATSADNKVVELDVFKPVKRYVRAVLSRGTANAAVNAIVADLYGARFVPAPAGDVIATAVKQG